MTSSSYTPVLVHQSWLKWRSKLHLLTERHIPRYYYEVDSVQLHGFCDVSEDAYSGVVYIRGQDRCGNMYVSLVISKTKVAPLKRLTIPRLELCGAKLLSQLLHHTQQALGIPTENVFAWTDAGSLGALVDSRHLLVTASLT